MASIVVGAAGIETISGALKRPKKQNGHNHGNYLIAVHRVSPTTNPNCQRLYSFSADRYKSSVPPSADTIAQRTRFGAIARMVNTRAHDQAKIAQDQAAFKAQTHYTTMRSYLWNVCTTEYYQSLG